MRRCALSRPLKITGLVGLYHHQLPNLVEAFNLLRFSALNFFNKFLFKIYLNNSKILLYSTPMRQ